MYIKSSLSKTVFIIILTFSIITSCSTNTTDEKKPEIGELRALEGDELRSRGQYLVAGIGCGDCHSPKNMTPQGPVEDSTRLMAGHPENETVQGFSAGSLKPGPFIQFSAGLTAFVGPWGISYAANLTPDSATGIGAWTGDEFMKAIKTGKHLGQDDGRPILPPMPWFNFRKFNDEDLKAIYTYLRSLPPVRNKVPAPVPPADAAALAAK